VLSQFNQYSDIRENYLEHWMETEQELVVPPEVTTSENPISKFIASVGSISFDNIDFSNMTPETILSLL
jgi:hypothetical protein